MQNALDIITVRNEKRRIGAHRGEEARHQALSSRLTRRQGVRRRTPAKKEAVEGCDVRRAREELFRDRVKGELERE